MSEGIYIFVNKETTNKIPLQGGHFLTTVALKWS